MVMETIERLMQDQHIPGLALAIQQGDTLLEEHYSGYANLEHSVLVTADTVFEIASVTKLFTAQAVLRLVQDGHLRLDDALGSYLAVIPAAWERVTIAQCLSHRSGIPSYTDPAAYWQITRHDKTHDEILALVRDLPLSFEPGARYAYDNTGFYLLGMIIEAVTGESYAEFLHKTIFAPLGMTQTCANDYERIVPHRAQGYAFEDGTYRNKAFYSTSNTFSAGILLSTVRDLLRWRTALYDDSILNADLRQRWWQAHPTAEGNEREFGLSLGLGWFMVDSPLGQFVGHNGGIQGFSSAFLHFRATGVTAIVLCNAGDVPEPHRIAFDIMTEAGLAAYNG